MTVESDKQLATNRNEASHSHRRVAVDRWLDEYGDVLYRYAKSRVGRRDVAEDLVQETLLAGIRGQHSFRNQSSERTWLVGILKRKIADYYRQRARDVAQVSLSQTDDWAESLFDDRGRWKSPPNIWEHSPFTPLERSEFWQVFTDCLGKVPDRMREAFSLNEIDEFSTEFICQEMGVTPTNLWVLLYRARLRLWKCLDANWFDGARTP